MILPTESQCLDLFKQYHVPVNILQHCRSVQKVAVFLAEQLVRSGYPIDQNVVTTLALLHDLMKVVVLERLGDPPHDYQATPEEEEAHRLLREKYAGYSETRVSYLLLRKDFPEFAKLFLELEEITKDPQALVSEEARFVHYVDWRVMGNKVVSLQERMQYIYEKYGKWITKKNIDWEATKKAQYDYEQKIFNHLPFTAEQLAEKVRL